MQADASAEFDWWFRASYGSVTRTVYLIVGSRSLAEEIAQDAFVTALRHWSKIHAYERPDAWIRRVAVRLAVKQAKRERSRRDRERAAVAGAVESLDPPWRDPEVARAVGDLSPMQRAAVVLYYWQDQPIFEIARALEVSESTVKQHLHRARIRLAQRLGEEVTGDVG